MNREEAIDILSTHYEPDDQRLEQALDMAIEALKAPHWIPCSERLPKKAQLILAAEPAFEAGCYITRFNPRSNYSFKAWMPLPEPYKEEEE